MIWIIVAVVVFIISMIIFYNSLEDGFTSIALSLLTAFIIFILGNSIGGSIITYTSEPIIVDEYEVYSTNTGNTPTNGTFALGFGYIDSERVYYYYVKNSDGTFSEEYIPVDDTKIIESDTTSPKVEVKSYEENKWLYLFDFDSIDGGKSYILYVPTGTITNTVNLE